MKIIMWGVVLSAMAAGGFAADNNIFSYRVGRFEVIMLVESRREGNSGILIGADDAAVARYIPGGTFPSETNTFLIRGGGRTVVVDTGFGTTIFESMRALGVRPDQVDAVLLTHLHGDHIGGLQQNGVARFPRAKLYLAKQERDYWLRDKPNDAAAAALAPYGSRTEVFFPGQLGVSSRELVPGIVAVAAFGHTPGHTMFLVESEGRKLLIWGDLMHAQNIQFPRPDISVTYDTDPAAAAAVRKQVLEYAAANRIPVAGMHLTYPAVGTVQAEGSGYRFTPAQ
jgi:glyoxylase-like metal-dependent hydrolase (beta-lactamase superfamily II)